MTHRPRVARGELSILTPAQADAIESLELDDERDAPMAEALLAMLGITLVDDEIADVEDPDEYHAEAEHIRRQEIADWESSRGSR